LIDFLAIVSGGSWPTIQVFPSAMDA